MRDQLLQQAAALARRGEPFVVALVVGRRAPSSAQMGDMALVTADGAFHGWLGGACTRPTVEREARAALADGKPRRIALDPDPSAEEKARRPGVTVFPMTCHSGGSVEIYLEPVLPAPRLAVFGASPIARALVEMGTALGYTAVTFDPGAGAMAASSSRETFAVVATMGEGDEEAVAAALALQPSYLGVVASAKRFAQMRTTLEAQGVSPATLDSVRSPAGLDLGARTAEEIALSVLAEIVQRRRRAEAGRADAELAAAPAAAQAIDPICGMTVEVASARHVAEHEGRTYHFCGAGCRQRFLAAPAVWIPAGETR